MATGTIAIRYAGRLGLEELPDRRRRLVNALGIHVQMRGKAQAVQAGRLNAAVGQETVHIIPVGDAVFALREHIANGTAPGLTQQTDLFRDPIGHPREPLAALVCYCHLAAITGRSPVGLPVPAELQKLPHAAELNALLEQLAWDAVSAYPLSGVKPVAEGVKQ